MAHIVKLLIKSLFSNPNSLSEVPEGALQAAENLVIDRESVAELRRGMKQFGDPFTSPSVLMDAFDRAVVLDGTTLKFDNTGNGTFESYSGNYSPPDEDVRMRGTSARNNFYFTTDNGVHKLDELNTTPVLAGAPRGLDIEAANTLTTGWMQPDTAVAYRMLWKTTDANQNEVLGAPCARVVLENNTGNTNDVNLVFTVPVGLSTDWSYQVYRSVMSLGADLDPGDDLFLCYEKPLTSTNISNGYVSFTDTVPEENLRDPLYTNETQEGILQANLRPPLAKDMTYVASMGCMMYANTQTLPQLSVTLLSTPAINTNVTIDSVVYTAKGSENIAANEFKTFTGGVAVDDIRNTLMSMITVMNRSAYNAGPLQNTTFYAYMVDALLPTLVIEGRVFGDSFSFTSSVTTWIAETLPISTTIEANSDEVFVSKPGEVEACPILQRYRVGLAGKRILRILAIQDATIVLKADGAWRITGFDPQAVVIEPINKTYEFTAPETGAAADNQVFGCTTLGPVSVTPTQVIPIGFPD